jgi:hypothetical protein
MSWGYVTDEPLQLVFLPRDWVTQDGARGSSAWSRVCDILLLSFIIFSKCADPWEVITHPDLDH